MIIDVKKYVFVGVEEDLSKFFESAQKKGIIQFLPTSGKKPLDLTKSAQSIVTAIKILKKETLNKENLYGKEYTAEQVAERAIFLKNSIEKLNEDKRQIRAEIAKVEVFGDFSLEEYKKLEAETGLIAQFYSSKITKREQIKLPKSLIFVGSDYSHDYFVGINETPKVFKDFLEIKIEHPLGKLKLMLTKIENDLVAFHQELQDLAGYIDFLKEALLDELNSYNLDFAKDEVLYHLDENLFSIESWIPTKYLPKVMPLLDEVGVHMEEIAVGKDEVVPTCMENKSLHKVGEDLVKIYDIPASNDKDPSVFVIGAFSIFFAMIVADAGYGMLYFLLSLFGYLKLSKKGGSLARMMKLFLMISSCTVVWGILIGSYFGIPIKPDNPIQKASGLQYLAIAKAKYHMKFKDTVYQEWVQKAPYVSKASTPIEFLLSVKKKQGKSVSYEILDEFNDNILIEIALLVGVLHICLSLFRYLPRSWSSIGWVLCIVGGYLFFPSMLHSTSIIHVLGIIPKKAGTEIGLQLLCVGIGVAWLLAFIQKKKGGFEEPLVAIQIFADILSYLRLYALALAGMIMASTFNQIGRDVGFALGFFIIIIGHMTNMVLGIMGGFIHGLRLNFLEWYHYSFEGGGKLFNPLRIFK